MSANAYTTPKWWKESAVYQVYPASFKDSNDDGWGDVRGVVSKLDYIKRLGVDAMWLSPIFKSPQVDMGYDISDYQDIDPMYGSLKDVDDLITEMGKRDLKLIMDLVVNHTSDQHPWFQSSISSQTSPKRTWYIWRPPASTSPLKPPNNWASLLGPAQSAWTYDPTSGDYYLSLFTPNQPDLNWENPAVRQAIYSMMHFWLDRGVKGFRLDVINCISKDLAFPDAKVSDPDKEYHFGFEHFISGPRFHEYLREMNKEVLSKYDCMTVGECDYAQNMDEETVLTTAPERRELNMTFQFDYINIDQPHPPSSHFSPRAPWTAATLASITTRLHNLIRGRDSESESESHSGKHSECNGWPTQVLENHDQPRSIGRFVSDDTAVPNPNGGSQSYRDLGAKLLALMETTLPGTLFLYQGQELGMRNAPLDWGVEEYKDVMSQNYYQEAVRGSDDDGEEAEERQGKAMKTLQQRARDHSRIPMPWDSTLNRGFCPPDTEPWMRPHDDYPTNNAASQTIQKDGLSVFQFWKRGLENRKYHKGAFVYGEYRGWDTENEKVFAYERWSGGEWGEQEGQDEEKSRWLVVLNFSGEVVRWCVPREVGVKKWVAGNYCAGGVEKEVRGEILLGPWEGVLGACEYRSDGI